MYRTFSMTLLYYQHPLETPPIHSSSSCTTTPYIPIPIVPVPNIPNSPQMRYCTYDNAVMEYLMRTAPDIKPPRFNRSGILVAKKAAPIPYAAPSRSQNGMPDRSHISPQPYRRSPCL